MSTTTLVQETLSLEEVNPCRFLVVYEDAATHDAAMEVCARLLARFEPEISFTFSFWKFNDLNEAASAHWAADAVARADIVLFSLSGRDLSPEAAKWLDSCVQARKKETGALALLITGLPGSGLAVEALLFRMQYAASRLRMDFLPLAPTPADAVNAVSAGQLSPYFHETAEESGGNHWGLNE
jgi:hypothetical protein